MTNSQQTASFVVTHCCCTRSEQC